MEQNAEQPMPTETMAEGAAQTPETSGETQMTPPVEGRRTQLKILRENLGYLSNDIGSFRRSHTASIKKLEKQVASLRSELAAQALSKDIGSFRKSHDASSKRLEKQVATLRNELTAMKSRIAKDAARSSARQEAALSRILAKVSVKPKAAKPSKAKTKPKAIKRK
jgi:hypothetical protein